MGTRGSNPLLSDPTHGDPVRSLIILGYKFPPFHLESIDTPPHTNTILTTNKQLIKPTTEKFQKMSSSKAHPCTFCTCGYNRPGDLRRHIRDNHPSEAPVQQCVTCSLSFPSFTAYAVHKRDFHLHAPLIKMWTCPFENCGLEYMRKQAMQDHYNAVHVYESRARRLSLLVYTCILCDDIFTGEVERDDHMAAHFYE